MAVAAAVEGLGSVAYHGPGGAWPKRLHDAGLVALAASRSASPIGREGRPVPPAGRSPPSLAVAAVALHALSRTGGPLCSCRSPLQGHAVFHVLAAAALDGRGRAALRLTPLPAEDRARPRARPSSPTDAGPPLGSSMP